MHPVDSEAAPRPRAAGELEEPLPASYGSTMHLLCDGGGLLLAAGPRICAFTPAREP